MPARVRLTITAVMLAEAVDEMSFEEVLQFFQLFADCLVDADDPKKSAFASDLAEVVDDRAKHLK
jgi:hypothetical protein